MSTFPGTSPLEGFNFDHNTPKANYTNFYSWLFPTVALQYQVYRVIHAGRQLTCKRDRKGKRRRQWEKGGFNFTLGQVHATASRSLPPLALKAVTRYTNNTSECISNRGFSKALCPRKERKIYVRGVARTRDLMINNRARYHCATWPDGSTGADGLN